MLAVPGLQSKQGYYITFNTAGSGTISAVWTPASLMKGILTIYQGAPFAGQPNPLYSDPPSHELVNTSGERTSFAASTGTMPAGQYTVYVLNDDSSGDDNSSHYAPPSTVSLTYVKAVCP